MLALMCVEREREKERERERGAVKGPHWKRQAEGDDGDYDDYDEDE